MKFLLYSQCGEGCNILHHIAQEGNEVGAYINDKLYKTVFDGILPKVNPDEFIDKDTVIIFDMSGNGNIADKYKRAGHYVYGASGFADDLEKDRKFGFEVMKKAGIKTPETKEFKTFKDGLAFVHESNKRLVFKPSGSMPCKLTYVSSNSEELVSYMQFVEKNFGKDIDSFVLQEFLEGCVVSSEYFCDGTKFIQPGNHTVEVKKSMNDDLGASTGCSGNITWTSEDSCIIEEGVAKVEKLCVENQYVGQIDLNAVINDSGVYGLEWTPRFGYDATPTFLTLVKGELGKFFSDICRGQMQEMDVDDKYAGSIRLTIPPYPAEPVEGVDTEEFSPNKGVPIQNYENFEDHIYFYEICREGDQLVHSGGTGVIGCLCGTGSNPKSSLQSPYKIAKDICIPDKQYRTDLVEVLSKAVREVESYGG